MTVNQIYSLLNDVSEQIYGADAIAAEDLSGLISMGDTVLSSSTDVDKFLGALVDRIGRTLIRNLDLEVNYPNLVSNAFEFGAALQKISVQPLDAVRNTAWDIGDANYVPNQYAISKGNVAVSIFSSVDTWKVRVTIPDDLFKTAFLSESQMAAFVDGLINSMSESMTLKLNAMNKLCVNNFIGSKLASGKNVVHLVTEYNAIVPQAEQIASGAELNAIYNAGFLKFMGKRISDHMRYMNEPNKVYNENGLVRRTARDNMHCFLMSEVNSAYDLYLTADTFHDNLVGLPFFQPVTAWQASNGEGSESGTVADMPDFGTASTINIKTSDGDTVNKAGIVCALMDREALGTTMYDLKSAAVRNDEDGYTNMSTRATVGYFNDLSEQGCVFVLD